MLVDPNHEMWEMFRRLFPSVALFTGALIARLVVALTNSPNRNFIQNLTNLLMLISGVVALSQMVFVKYGQSFYDELLEFSEDLAKIIPAGVVVVGFALFKALARAIDIAYEDIIMRFVNIGIIAGLIYAAYYLGRYVLAS